MSDETVEGYERAEAEGTQEPLPEPPGPHIEETELGATVVHEPEAQTFDLDHNAPRQTVLDKEVAADQADYEKLNAEPTDHHLEVEHEDEDLEEELQDGVLEEDELIDMAPAKDLFDDPEGADEDEEDEDA